MSSNLDINVELIDPLGAQLGRWSKVDSLSGEATARNTGVHTMLFDNSYSLFTSKDVDLRYRVVPQGGR